jgi:hypothetical protein
MPLMPAPAKPKFTQNQIRTLPLLPPVQYDKPYPGVVLEARVANVPALRAACNNSTATVACSYPNFKLNVCLVIIISDEALQREYWTLELIRRHEVGHCNGWMGDHAGARTLQEVGYQQ